MSGPGNEPAPHTGGGPGSIIRRARARVSRYLGWRLVLYLTGSLFVLLGASGWLALKLHREHLYELREQTATGMGETILNSTHYSMLENDSEQLEQILSNIARRTNVVALRLIDARGKVRYSKDPEEMGRLSDITAPVCQGCHSGDAPQAPATLEDGLRLYSLPSGEGALGLAVPVLNSLECSNASCHVHPAGQRVLGMLDLELSTLDLENAMDAARDQMAGLALLTMLGSSAVIGLFAWRMVHRPLHRVLDGIRRVGPGELSHRLPETELGEVGELVGAFNQMSDRLQIAQAELEGWNQTLEAKVAEKTRELEHTRDQMVFAEKMASLGKLAAIVAHEINNPLAGVLVYTKLVRRRLPKLTASSGGGNGIREMDETLATIETETARCGDIVRNLLLFSRRGESSLAPADVNGVLRRALRLIQHQADLAGITVDTDLGDIPAVVCDAGEIQQAVLAPLMNGLEAMPEGGTLTVRTRHDPGSREVLVEIRDTGVGIPAEIRPKIFEPFFSTKSEGKGTGLGLAVMYGIVQRHRGRIDLESELGRGTLFRIHLPVEGPGDVAAAAPEAVGEG